MKDIALARTMTYLKKIALQLFLVFSVIAISGQNAYAEKNESSSKSKRIAVAVFDAGGQVFKVRVENAETIKQLISLWQGKSDANIPMGTLRWGPGKNYHNRPWKWHMDPQEIEMAQLTAEVCDGFPSDIESDLPYWIEDVGAFCPWTAKLVSLRLFYK